MSRKHPLKVYAVFREEDGLDVFLAAYPDTSSGWREAYEYAKQRDAFVRSVALDETMFSRRTQ